MFKFNGYVGRSIFFMLTYDPTANFGSVSVTNLFEDHMSSNGMLAAHFLLTELVNQKLITARKDDDKIPRYFMTRKNIARWQSRRNHEMFQP